jgi:hypothetical protein
MRTKKTAIKSAWKRQPTVGERIIEGLEEAIAWSKGENIPVRVTEVQLPDLDISVWQ